MKRCILVVLIIAAAPGAASAQELTVYSSLPLSGAARGQTKAVNDGARQALQEAGGTAGGRPIRLVTLNDATRRAGTWVPQRVVANARRAVQDRSAVAYIGEFNSGASRIAIPITNEAGLPMVSPSNTYNGLTTGGAGTDRGEPARWYPSGQRTYFRLLPNDHVQAAALATAIRDRGCTRVALAHDREVYGRGMVTDMRATLGRLGVPVVATRGVGLRTRSYSALTRARPDCVAYGGITANGAVRLFRAVGRGRQMFASDGVAESGFARRVPRSIARRTIIAVATLPPTAYGLPSRVDPYRALGYEAMKVILDAINRGGPSRAGVLAGLRATQNRASVLGTYGFDANGDTTLRTYGLYTIRGRALQFVSAITAA